MPIGPPPKGKHNATREADTIGALGEVRAKLAQWLQYIAGFREERVFDTKGRIYTVLAKGGGAYPYSSFLPWDYVAKKLWPGSVAGIVPAAMFGEVAEPPESGEGYYYVEADSSNGKSITSATLKFSTTNPGPFPSPTKDAAPTPVKVVVGVSYNGTYYNVLKQSVGLVPVEVFKEQTGEDTYSFWYGWTLTF
jgi:hypothetical protein